MDIKLYCVTAVSNRLLYLY
uniref:Uncharacterized protein n=1 Tax=Anguilla anguilla TaxID=7936 RepID=A0A0E9RSM0_ANGAN